MQPNISPQNNNEHNPDDTVIKASPEPSQPETHKNNKSIVYALIIVIILALVGIGTTWYLMNKNSQQQKADNAKQIQKIQDELDKAKKATAYNLPTKTYTTKYEKITFSYPENWTLVDTSVEGDQTRASGSDNISITSPDKFRITINTGMDGVGGCCGGSVAYSEPLTILGKNYYINYINYTDEGKKNNEVSLVVLDENKSGFTGGYIKGKNIMYAGKSTPLPMLIIGYFDIDNPVPLATAKANPDAIAFEAFLRSLTY